jgi:hypothetical protein
VGIIRPIEAIELFHGFADRRLIGRRQCRDARGLDYPTRYAHGGAGEIVKCRDPLDRACKSNVIAHVSHAAIADRQTAGVADSHQNTTTVAYLQHNAV